MNGRSRKNNVQRFVIRDQYVRSIAHILFTWNECPHAAINLMG